MPKLRFILATLFIVQACGSSPSGRNSNEGRSELTPPEIVDSASPQEIPQIAKQVGANSFKIFGAISRDPVCITARRASFDGNDTGFFQEGCVDENGQIVPGIERTIVLSEMDRTRLVTALASIDLARLREQYYSPAETDANYFAITFRKETDTYRSIVALQDAKDLPDDLALFLQIAADLTFIPGAVITKEEIK